MFNKTIALLLASIAYTAALIYYSSLPYAGPAGHAPPSGNFLHFIAYAVYAAILFVTTAGVLANNKRIIAAFLIAVVVGAVAELIQLYVPGRVCDVFDWLVGAFGAAVGLVVVFLLIQRRKNTP